MLHLLILALLLTAFACLATTSERHRPAAFRKKYRGLALSIYLCAWLLLALALVIAVQTIGWALGLVIWFGHASIAAALVYCLLVFFQRPV
jgi:hypothetical protein